jgi:hypothetical protein
MFMVDAGACGLVPVSRRCIGDCRWDLLHSQWPPLTWRNVHFTTDDYGQQLLLYAAVFVFIALIYFTLPRFPRLRMNRALGYVHFGICTAAVIAETFLEYWMSVTYKNVPGEGWFDALFRGFGAAMTSFIWGLYIFVAAQLVFFFNLSWSIFLRVRSRSILKPAKAVSELL